ncbi:hypothetical protein ACG04Q_16130 [Roseateles sp. DXS20W]|uniref:Lipase helper protein n=1 Tax=Pelomonas lactea TaxID=3299030 RepID=A0ABW7GMA9_9BURK
MRRAAALALAVAAAAGCVAWSPRGQPPAAVPAAAPAPAPAVAGPELAPPGPASAAAVQTATAADAALPPSLQGTEADGGWRADAQGRLVVDRALRRRLDYWLSTVGEVAPEVIGARLLAAAARDLPPPALQELQALWGRYVALQRHPWQRVVLPADPSSWRPALEERQSVRRQQLGRATADAFYGDEEQRLWRDILAREAGQSRPDDAVAPVAEHPQAAQRVAAVQAEWARWDARVAEARAEWGRLQAAVALSAPQREAAWAGWLAARFDATEQLRVRGLVEGGGG